MVIMDCNCRIIKYPDGHSSIMISDRSMWDMNGNSIVKGVSNKWDSALKDSLNGVDSGTDATGTDMDIQDGAAVLDIQDASASLSGIIRSQRRARAKIKHLSHCMNAKYFVTLTLDKSKIDRYDISVIVKRLNTWLDNRVRRHGLQYILVPERHKDGAVHFHGFINDALPVVDSGTLTGVPGRKKPAKPRSDSERQRWLEAGARVVYNLPSWDYGFTTAIELYGDKSAAVSYVQKYITKDSVKVGGRWYYNGGIEDASIKEYCAVDIHDVCDSWYSFTVEATGQRFWLVEAD